MANDKDFKVKNGLDVGSTVTLQAYGQGNNTGTAAKLLAVDSSGNLIEEAPSAGGGIANVVEDTTPQLGGNLDVNGNSIVSVSGGDIAITPDADGQIVLDGLNWPISDGTDRQVLVTDGSGELTFDDIPPVQVAATNNTGSSIAAGTPVYQTGVSGQNITIAPADASSSSTMPAVGVTKGTISASGGTGVVVVSGFLKGINTSAYTAGDTLFVANGGGFTTSLSNLTGEGNLIENLGKVVKSDTSAGSIIVTGAGRANATPNLNDGNFFLGNASNQAVSADFTTSVRGEVSATDAGGDGSFSYNSGTGVFTYTGPSAAEVRAHLSAGGDLSYNSSTGVFSFTERTASEILTDLKTVDGAASGLDADLLDGQHGSHYLDWTNTTNKPDPTITLGGDLSGSVTLTDLASGTLTATIGANSVALGTDTTGNYVADVDGTANQIDVSYTPSEGGTPTIGLATNVTTPGNLTVSGNLTVNGSSTTIESTTVAVEDSLFKLAKDNTADSVDAGWYGVYNDGTEKYAGIARDASDSGKFILYDGLQVEPTTTVNTAGTGFNKATLKADIEGAVDLNGGVLTLDADADTTITADTDDQIDIAFSGNDRIQLSSGLIDLKNDGTQSAVRLYCEVSNAHYAALQAPAHSDFSGNVTVTLPSSTDTLVGRATTDTLTNKTINASNNTVSNLAVSNFAGSAIVTQAEGIGSNDNETTIPTSAAVKDYVDTNATGNIQSEEFPTVTAGSANVTMSQSYALTHIEVYLNGVKLRGGTGHDYTVSGTTLTFSENLESGDVVCIVALEDASTFTISGTFANLTDTSVSSQATNTLIRYDGTNYVPTSLTEGSSGNVAVAGSLTTEVTNFAGGTRNMDVRKANAIYNSTASASITAETTALINSANTGQTVLLPSTLSAGDIITVYCNPGNSNAGTVVKQDTGGPNLRIEGETSNIANQATGVTVGVGSLAVITVVSSSLAIIAGSDLS